MILYHVTLDISEPKEKLFMPRVPESIGNGENNVTPRICFSDSIEKCLQAIHTSVSNGTIIRVYQKDFSYDDIIHPEDLKNNYNVPDAMENNEYWYTKPITLTSNLYQIINYRVEYEFAWSCIRFDDLVRILSKYMSNVILSILIHDSNQDPKKLYNLFCNIFVQEKRYEDEDKIYDEIAELPWATLRKITDLEVKLLSEEDLK